MAPDPKSSLTSPAFQTALAALSTPLPPIRPRLGYRLALALSAASLVLVLVIYLTLIAGTVVLMHLERRWFAGSPALLMAVLIPEAILVLFLLKPLFRRPQIRDCPLRLARADEPALYAFVDRLCAVTGAQPPKAIDVVCDVNAAAGFDGLFRGFLRNELILTIGLPLAAGLSVQQFAGVIAHELAHFAQYGATRLSYVTRKLNGWLARCVYERDRWDHTLERLVLKSPWIIAVWCYLLWRTIALARGVLWTLLRAAHFFCAKMLREMEFEADRYASQIMGAAAFADTARRIALLSAGSDLAYRDLNRAWLDRRLGEDLPDLMLTRVEDFAFHDQQAIEKSSLDHPIHWYDTHPTDRQRIARVAAAPADGVLRCDLPAALLFADFARLSRECSLAFYRMRFGPAVEPAWLITAEELHRARARDAASLSALARFGQNLVNAFYPLPFPADIEPARDLSAAIEQLRISRRVFDTTLAAARAAARRLDQEDLREIQLAAADGLFTAGFTRINLRSIGATGGGAGRDTRAELVAARRLCRQNHQAAAAAVAPALRMLLDRWRYALAIAQHPDHSPGGLACENGPRASIAALLQTLSATAAVGPLLATLRIHQSALGFLGAELRRGSRAPHLRREVLARARACRRSLQELREKLAGISNPFAGPSRAGSESNRDTTEHAAATVTLADFVVEHIPTEQSWRGVAAIYRAAGAVIQRYVYLHFRLMGALAVVAEEVETTLQLEPLPAPSHAPAEFPIAPVPPGAFTGTAGTAAS